MNGISMDNPFALLMNLNVGAGLGQPMGAVPGFPMPEGNVDLLGFVNALEVSQGPASPVGEDLSQMTEELVSSDLEQKKQVDLSAASSNDLLSSMMASAVEAKPIGEKALIKTTNENDVGRRELPKVVLGETQLLGDLIKVAPPKLSIDKLAIEKSSFEKPIKEQDVAIWSQAFAQNDIESIDLVNERPSAVRMMANSEKLSSSDKLQLANSVDPNQMTTDSFVSAVAKSAPAKTEAAQPTFTAFKGESKPKTKDVVVDASELLLSREVMIDGPTRKESSGVIKSSSSLGTSSDLRLSDDSVKMLADKIEAIKDSGSSTLRVVLSTDSSGKIEIRVQKIAGEIRIQLSSDSKEMTQALEGSKAELAAKLADRVSGASVDVRPDMQSAVSESSSMSPLKNVLHSADVLRMGQSSEAKVNVAASSSSSSSDFGSDFSGKHNPEFRDQSGREDSRDRGMRKWQGIFEERESA